MAFIESETIEINSKKVKIVYLNNPATKNSMSWEMGVEFNRELESSAKDRDITCMILTGRNNVFSGGGDLDLLKSFIKNTKEENKKIMIQFYNFFLGIRNLPFPVLGAINGHAIGAALSLAFACDLRVFAEDAKYSFNFVKLGIHPGMGSSYITKELFGGDLANRLLFLGEYFNGKEALKMNLCLDAVPTTEVLKRTVEIAISICENAPIATMLLKRNLYDNTKLQTALEKEATAQGENFVSEDFKETIRSIEEKRKPSFSGR